MAVIGIGREFHSLYMDLLSPQQDIRKGSLHTDLYTWLPLRKDCLSTHSDQRTEIRRFSISFLTLNSKGCCKQEFNSKSL